MAAVKSKKSKRKKKKKTSEKVSKKKGAALAEYSKQEIIFKYIFSGLLFVYILFYILKLFTSLGETFFWADENVHAYISSVILDTHSLPALLPEDIYGGFKWSYPPLFHIMAAGIMAVAGFAALKYINLALLLLFFICLYFLILKYYGHNEAVIACLLISLSPALAINSIRFMTDMLSMFLIFFSAFFFLLAIEKENILHAVLSGMATGLLLLSKQTGIIALSFYCLLLIWFLWKDKKKAKIVLYILGVAATIYLPYLIWAIYNKIDIFGFLSLFLGNKPEWARIAVKSFRRSDSSLIEFAYLFYTGNGLIITISLLIPIVYMIKSRAKEASFNIIFSLLFYLMLAMAVWHITNTRHTLSLLPILTFLIGYALIRIFPQKIIINIIILLFFVTSAFITYKMPNYREKYNGPTEFISVSQIIKTDNSTTGRVLCINAFDVLMYTQKPVIWPYPNLQNIPLDLFEKQSSQELYDLLNKYSIKYVLINRLFLRNTDVFYGRNYPLPFMRNLEILDKQGKIVLETLSDSTKWILLKII